MLLVLLGVLLCMLLVLVSKAGAIFRQPRRALLASGSNAAYFDATTRLLLRPYGLVGLPKGARAKMALELLVSYWTLADYIWREVFLAAQYGRAGAPAHVFGSSSSCPIVPAPTRKTA